MKVLDSSAVLAFLVGEPGGDITEKALQVDSRISAANWSEVAQKTGRQPGTWVVAKEVLLSFGLRVEPVTQEDAETAAALWHAATSLSLADRLCLALGARLDAEVLTADRAWAGRPGVALIR